MVSGVAAADDGGGLGARGRDGEVVEDALAHDRLLWPRRPYVDWMCTLVLFRNFNFKTETAF